MKLRAHHLLCIQGYEGKGYSQDFINNMNNVISTIESNPNTKISLVSQLDDVCAYCPSNIGNELCKSQIKVEKLDLNTLKTLQLEVNKEYTYSILLNKIKEKLTKEKFETICCECQWFQYGYCKEGLGFV